MTFRFRETTKLSDEMRRLCMVPGVGLMTAGAILAFAPDLQTFASGEKLRGLARLVPRQRSTGGKARLGATSKIGQSAIRKFLIVGAMSRIRWIVRNGVLPDNWLGHILRRKPLAIGVGSSCSIAGSSCSIAR